MAKPFIFHSSMIRNSLITKAGPVGFEPTTAPPTNPGFRQHSNVRVEKAISQQSVLHLCAEPLEDFANFWCWLLLRLGSEHPDRQDG